MVGGEPQDGERPVERVEQVADHGAAHGHLEAEPAGGAERAPEREGVAHVHQPGLGVALDPARALAEPTGEAAVGLLPGGRIHHQGAVAALVQAHAEVAVLGDVEGIPAAQLAEGGSAEMVGGAAEGGRGRSGR